MNTNYTLKELINVEALQGIQDKFADATGLAAVIVNREGIPVTKPSNFTSFCTTIRSCSKGFQKCKLSDSQGGINAKDRGKPAPYVCEHGLIDVAAPIILENSFIGTILCGQIIFEEEGRKKTFERVQERVKDHDLDFETLKEKFNNLEVLPREKIVAAAEFLSLSANYIAKMGLVNIYQQELIEESRNRKQLEKHLRTKQLKILQSQVNPHFLFNVLNSIARLALIENAQETEDVTYALADLLRYSLRNIEEIVSLKDEINCVKDYIVIQKKRYRNQFNFKIDINQKLYDINIPLLSIQPLIENAIIHGFKERDSGTIEITSKEKKEKVVIIVKDDGAGIKPNILNNIFSYEDKNKEKITTHITGIGVNNVHKRLNYYFGNEYGLEIDSKFGQGTEVRINLPKNNN